MLAKKSSQRKPKPLYVKKRIPWTAELMKWDKALQQYFICEAVGTMYLHSLASSQILIKLWNPKGLSIKRVALWRSNTGILQGNLIPVYFYENQEFLSKVYVANKQTAEWLVNAWRNHKTHRHAKMLKAK